MPTNLRSSLPLLASLLLLSAAPVLAEVALTGPFGSHMVLQCQLPIPVWGTAAPGEEVTVEFGPQRISTLAGRNGRWRVELAPLRASAESRTFTVRGSATAVPLQLEDVVVGEVWLCGGQSNMERQLGLRPGQQPIFNWEQEVAAADYPFIRQCYVPQRRTLERSASVESQWTVCSPSTVADFSAVGYFFARDLYLARDVPIGIIHSSVGATPAEAWTSEKGLAGFPEFNEALTQLDGARRDLNGTRQAYPARLEAWYRAIDPGSASLAWHAPELDPTGWETMNLPTVWETAGHPGYDGVAWFRKSFDLPPGWEGRDLQLRIGGIDDMDTTWVNGVKVGSGSGWKTLRLYPVPAALLKPKDNIIAVRVLDIGGNGGLWDPALPLDLVPLTGDEAPLSLAGPWLARFGTPLVGSKPPPMDVTSSSSAPTVLFNAMIAPLIPYAIRGVAFYQGEANAARPAQYGRLLPALIADWRRQWGQGNFPFLFVQLAPYKDLPPEIREAQLIAWQVTTNTAMAVTVDCGDADDIHPVHKQPVGARLALAARALAYGEKLEYSGPVYAGLNVSDGHAVLRFTHLGGGLVGKDGPLTGFTIAGADRAFHPAVAEIRDDTVVVSSPSVPQPVAVRYAWANVASGNLFNAAGLPASPFRTDAN